MQPPAAETPPRVRQSSSPSGHPPLRRVSRGLPAVTPSFDHHPPPHLLFVNPFVVAGSPPSSTGSVNGALTINGNSGVMATLESHDSCYSSCSEESHGSLSREASDTLATELGQLSFGSADDHLVDFATKLGYSENQLQLVLEKLGSTAGQDRILAELIKLGKSHGPLRVTRSTGSITAVPSPPPLQSTTPSQLRSIVIDGSNIAMTHGHKEVFSCRGIRECVDFFASRGHRDIKVFVPQFRRESPRSDCPITDQHILMELEAEGVHPLIHWETSVKGVLVWTPSRRVGGRRIVCHDDRYVLKTAAERDAVVVSNDEYRDLAKENPQFRRLVEERLLMYSFVDGRFMPPDDPMGRRGPKLEQFLSIGGSNTVASNAQLCPYARKCTYGNKCKYFHPERPNGVHVSVTDRLMMEKNQRKQCLSARPSLLYETSREHTAIGRTRSLNVPVTANSYHHSQNVDVLLAVPPNVWQNNGYDHHQSLNRNLSAPLSPPSSSSGLMSGSSKSSSASDLQWHPFPVDEPWAEPVQGHLFVPSTAVWGESEFSVAPVTRGIGSIQEPDRARLQYHLCQLFPENAVMAVMDACPEEKDAQKLCANILALQNGFQFPQRFP